MIMSIELLRDVPELEAHAPRLAGLGVHAICLGSSPEGTVAGIHLRWADAGTGFGWVLAERATAQEARRAAIALLSGIAEAQVDTAQRFPPLPDAPRGDRREAIQGFEGLLGPFGGPPTSAD